MLARLRVDFVGEIFHQSIIITKTMFYRSILKGMRVACGYYTGLDVIYSKVADLVIAADIFSTQPRRCSNKHGMSLVMTLSVASNKSNTG